MLRKRIIRWSLVSVLMLGVAEVGLRLMGLGNPILQVADKDCGYLFAPNQQSTRFGCTNHINAFSQRSDDVASEKPAGTYRILMIGDSVLYGTTYVDQSRIFSTQIQRDLPAKVHEPVQVLNASVGGWATGNELGYLTSRGTFQSDMVVFVLNTGDLEVINNVVDLKVEGGADKPYCALTELWSHYIYPRVFHAPVHVDSGSLAKGDGEDVYPRIDAVLANIATAKQYANEHGAGFAVLFSPALGGNWENAGYQYGYGRLQVFLGASDIPMVNMTSAYRQVPLDQLYYGGAGGIHLKPMGHDIVAHAFVEAVPELQVALTRQTQPRHQAVVSAAR